MSINLEHRRSVGALSILAGAMALVSLVIGLAGVDFDAEVLSDDEAILAASDAIDHIRWSYWLNMLGNYLLLVPLALLLHGRVARVGGLAARAFTAAGIVYLVFGAAGSAILAEAWPHLMERYAGADAAGRAAALEDFELVNAVAGGGLHGVVQNLAGAAWLAGIGWLMRPQARILGAIAIAISAFLVLATIGTVVGVEALNVTGVTATVLLAPAWAIALGIRLMNEARD